MEFSETVFLPFFSGVLEYYHASLEPIMQYPYLRTDVFQGFREIGNAILFCLQLESFLVRNITFRLRVVPHFAACKMRWEAGDFFSSLRSSPSSRVAIFTCARVSRSRISLALLSHRKVRDHSSPTLHSWRGCQHTIALAPAVTGETVHLSLP